MTQRSESIEPCLCGEVREDDCGHPDCPIAHPERRRESIDPRRLCAAPITLADANRYVETFHRHNGRLPAARFSMAAVDAATGEVHGIAIAGIPKARMLDDGLTLEVNRVCTDGTRNCCSFLYGCCKRAAKALGYALLITYTQADEDGASLKASGWECDGDAGGGSWFRQVSNPRATYSGAVKRRWHIDLNAPAPRPTWPWPKPVEHPALFAEDKA